MTQFSFALSVERPLLYVLRANGCRGRLTAGSIERTGPNSINLYDEKGTLLDYFSGHALRSWWVADVQGNPVEDWHYIAPEDAERVQAL